ncbi:hypothetical protein ACIBCA_16840 [Kitasatospora sp. NPDC051170]|uniref:hypothetical protein n=1 Tax=Kitasatospora sp. NPDC051170 TaxID=3364056 RepID=UPI0037A6715C
MLWGCLSTVEGKDGACGSVFFYEEKHTAESDNGQTFTYTYEPAGCPVARGEREVPVVLVMIVGAAVASAGVAERVAAPYRRRRDEQPAKPSRPSGPPEAPRGGGALFDPRVPPSP